MKETHLIEFFWHAGFFLALSALVIPVLRYFKMPIALGYLFAGIALGPYGISVLADDMPFLHAIVFEDIGHVKILAELGIVLLLFVIGLELTPRRLWQMRNLVFGLGGIQVIVTAVCIGSVAYMWGNAPSVSVLLGLSFALSSTAIVTQWLHEQKLFVTHMGRASFSVLLLQDLAVIPILLLLEILVTNTGDDVLQFVSISILKMGATVIGIYLVGKLALRHIFVFANRHGGAEVFMALTLLTIVLSASVAALAGLSMALGAFIAGLLLADTEYRHEISALVIPFKGMLLGIFFFSFGMGIDLHFIAEKPLWIMASVIGLMAGKAAIMFALCKLFKQTTAVAAESAILLSQAGEFGLLVIGSALTAGFVADNVGQFMLIVVGMTMLITPVIAPIARKIGLKLEALSHQNKDYHANQVIKKADHVVIFGYGRIGSRVGEQLSEEGWSIIGFEKDLDRVQQARSKSAPVFYGDATKASSLEAAQLETAFCVVVTLDDADATKRIVQMVRKVDEDIPIITRARDTEDFESLSDMPNVQAVAEFDLLSHELSSKTLQLCTRKPDSVSILPS